MEQVENLYTDVNKTLFDSASWVSNRLSELLPFELTEKQALLEIATPYERMQKITELMPRFQKD